MAFLDLRQVPLSALINWILDVGGAAALQAAALDAWRWRSRQADRRASLWLLLLASACIWFFSGQMLLFQNGSFYHEPFAAGLLCSGIFTLLSVRVLFFGCGAPSAGVLIGMALAAGASVFARQTVAVALYAGVLAWLAVSGWQVLRPQAFRPGAILRWILTRAAVPLALLLAAGVAYLAMNYARWGRIDSFPFESYGATILRPDDPRLLNLRSDQFNWVRIVPNLIFALIGGDELRNRTIAMLGGGHTEAMGPIMRLLIAWPASFILSLVSLTWLVRAVRRDRLAALSLLIVACLAISAVLQLAYATAQYRYWADVWPPLGFLVVMSVAVGDQVLRSAPWRKAIAAVGFSAAAVSGVYVWSLVQRGLTDGDFMHQPLPQALADRATAPEASDPGLPGGIPPPGREQIYPANGNTSRSRHSPSVSRE
jgi:hypothetical protein